MNVAVVTVPPLVATLTVLGPITALAGTFRLVLQLPQTSTWTIPVFHELSLKVMPPAGIVSSGTKLALLIVTRTLKVPVLVKGTMRLSHAQNGLPVITPVVMVFPGETKVKLSTCAQSERLYIPPNCTVI